MIREAVARNEVPAYHAAYLEDRICVFEGRPQRYGTQFDWDENGKMSPMPLQDPQQVDALRESIGLGTLAEKASQVRAELQRNGERPPVDYAAYVKEKRDWAKSVGWL